MELRKPITPKQAREFATLAAAADRAHAIKEAYAAGMLAGLKDVPEGNFILDGDAIVFTVDAPLKAVK